MAKPNQPAQELQGTAARLPERLRLEVTRPNPSVNHLPMVRHSWSNATGDQLQRQHKTREPVPGLAGAEATGCALSLG